MNWSATRLCPARSWVRKCIARRARRAAHMISNNKFKHEARDSRSRAGISNWLGHSRLQALEYPWNPDDARNRSCSPPSAPRSRLSTGSTLDFPRRQTARLTRAKHKHPNLQSARTVCQVATGWVPRSAKRPKRRRVPGLQAINTWVRRNRSLRPSAAVLRRHWGTR